MTTPRLIAALGLAALFTSRQFAVWTEPSQRFFYHWTRGDGVALVASLLLLAGIALGADALLRRWPPPHGPRVRRTVLLLVLWAGLASLAGAGGHPVPVIPVTAAFLLLLPLLLVLGDDRIGRGVRARVQRWHAEGEGRQRTTLLAAAGLALVAAAWSAWPLMIDVAWWLQGLERTWFPAFLWAALGSAAWHLAGEGVPVMRGARFVLTLAAPLGLLITMQALWWGSWGPDTTIAPTAATGGSQGPPVVLIVFDEWSRETALRPDGTIVPGLPGVAAVSAGSVTFSGALASGTSTLKSVPRLLAGAPGELVPGTAGAIWVDEPTGARTPFAEVGTVISEARAAGYVVDIFGYYLPYPRLFAGQLRAGFSPPSVPRPEGAFDRLLATLRRSVYFWPIPGARDAFRRVEWWRRPVFDHAWYDLQGELADSAVAAVSRLERGEFLLLHLPTPHPPMVRGADGARVESPWRGDSLAWKAGYAAQVRWTDHLLGRLWEGLGTSGLRDSALIVITSDHAWRSLPLAEWMPAERFLQVPLWVRWPGAPVGFGTPRTLCLTRLGPLFTLAFRGDSALRGRGFDALEQAVGAEGCLAEPPPTLRVDWF
jgi:hypothetical protein